MRDEEQSRCELPEWRGRHGLLGSWAPPPSPFTHSENRKKLWGGAMQGGVPTPAHAVLSSAHYSPVEGEDSTGELDICPWQPGEPGDSECLPQAWEPTRPQPEDSGGHTRVSCTCRSVRTRRGVASHRPVRRAGLEVRACRKSSCKEPAGCTDSVKGLPWSQNRRAHAPAKGPVGPLKNP